MEIKRLYLLFKTHLDIGFTDFSENIVKRYMTEYIPNAIRVSRELKKTDDDARFVWTTGSWLISEYLNTHSGKEKQDLEDAIRAGDICWHGLPFTTHTELMSKELFEYGLSIGQSLDDRFNKHTVAAKMTDVPGHTKAIIPLLKNSGIEFLHIGVNPASAVPDVPEIFRWQADSGEQITVMYNADYGTFAPLGDTGSALYFAHTGDNLGGQSAEQVIALYRELHEKFPQAQLIAANLNDIAVILREIEDTLPVVTDEIADSWIHGVGTDPKKVSQFRAMERLATSMPQGNEKQQFLRGLLLVPEHTWGLNGQINLADHENYARSAFEKVRSQPNYQRMEASWVEQRRYVSDAVATLSGAASQQAWELLSGADRAPACAEPERSFLYGETVNIDGVELAFDETGAVIHLKVGNQLYADREHRLGCPLYEQFSDAEYKRFYGQYNRLDVLWAQEDYTKIGMQNAGNEYEMFYPKAQLYKTEKEIIVRYTFSEKAFLCDGCPKTMDLKLWVSDGKLEFDYAWFDKPANRITEALWIKFHPIAAHKRISKLGVPIDPCHVVNKGNRRLHATDFGVIYDRLTIESRDAALVAPGKPSLLDFVQDLPTDDEAVFFNLYNNVWATNFPMWYDENARFRFEMTFLSENEVIL